MRKIYFSLILSFVVVAGAFAQRTVSGKVTDENGEGLPGVNVVIKGTTTGVTTDLNGNYQLSVPDDNAILVFSSVGMVVQELAVGTRTTLDVGMSQNIEELDEVIVVAYGTANKASFTGSASVISQDLIKDRPITNAANALQGTVAGLQSTSVDGTPGSAPSFQIRGTGTFSASTDPLIVVDGVAYDQNVNNLNPADIESMSVLKDAASTALYGSRAANGVIMITTKRGSSGDAKVNLRVMQGWVDRGIPQYEKIGTEQYYTQMWEGYRNELVSGGNDLATAGTLASQNLIANKLGYNVYNVANDQLVSPEGIFNPNASLLYNDFDWFGAITRTGTRSDIGADVSGGTESSDYFISIGHLKEEGYLIKSEFERYTARIVTNNQLNNWLKMGLNLSGTYSESTSNGAASGSGAFANPFNFARFMGPIYPIYVHDPVTGEFMLDGEGKKIFDPGGITGTRPNSPGRHNVQEQLLDVRGWQRTVVSTRTYVESKFLNDFTFRANAGVDLYNLYDTDYRNTIVGDGAPSGRSERTTTNQYSITLNQVLSYKKELGDHYVDVLAGHESYNFIDKTMNTERGGQIAAGNVELANFATLNGGSGDVDEEALESYFFRTNYEFKGRYIASFSYRTDGSSRLAPENRWGDFFAVGMGWIVSDEAFLSGATWVNRLKLRASWGETGNVAGIGYYPYQGLYSILPNAAEPGFVPGNPSNPTLGWETQIQSDVAVDFNLFDNKLSGTVEYFDRTSKDLLFDVPLATSLGIPGNSITQNIGSFKNSGFEIQLGSDLVRAGAFTWNLNVNATMLKNRIQELPDGEEIDNGTKRLKEGGDFYAYYMRDYAGVDEATGDPLYRGVLTYDAARDFIVGNDTLTPLANNARLDYIGKSASPDVFGGITSTFAYKGLSLRVLFTYQIGGWQYDGTYGALMDPDYGDAAHVDLAKAWKAPGDKTDVPRYDPTNSPNVGVESDRWLIDGTHLNLRQVTLAYEIPKTILNQVRIPRANAYLTGENLALFSKREGLNVNRSFAGTSSNSYLPSKVLTFGLNISL